MTQYADYPRRKCPRCGSPKPEHHPAVQFEGEVETCIDDFHLIATAGNRPEFIAAVHAKRGAPPPPAVSGLQDSQQGSKK